MIIKVFFWLVFAVILFFLFVKFLEKRSIYFPYREIETTPQAIGLPFEEIQLTTADNTVLHAWLITHPGADYIILFCHGNAGNISHRIDKIAFFNSLGLSTLMFDYRGYGKSRGSPSEEGLYQDVRSAYDFLTHKKNIPKNNIILYGESLGGAVAIDLASKQTVGALITEEAFSSVPDMAKVYYPFVPSFLIVQKYDSLSKISTVSCPKLIIHSRDDDIVPFHLGEKLFKAAQEPKRFLEVRGSHNATFFISIDTIKEAILQFLEDIQKH